MSGNVAPNEDNNETMFPAGEHNQRGKAMQPDSEPHDEPSAKKQAASSSPPTKQKQRGMTVRSRAPGVPFTGLENP